MGRCQASMIRSRGRSSEGGGEGGGEGEGEGEDEGEGEGEGEGDGIYLREVPDERLVVGVDAVGGEAQVVDVHQIENTLHLRLAPIVPCEVGQRAVALRDPLGERPLVAQALRRARALVTRDAPAPVDRLA